MLNYTLRRLMYMVIILLFISMFSFILIQLPPGDYLSSYIKELETSGQQVDEATAAALRKQFGLDQPVYQQYFIWIKRILLKGDFGRSLEWDRPVKTLLIERLPWTLMLFSLTFVFTYLVAIPIGIYSATNQYSLGDNIFTIFGFAGLAIPNFMLALILMYLFNKYFGMNIGGLFSAEFAESSWGFNKVLQLLKSFIIPVIVIGTAGTAGIIRVMRGTLLDELGKQYVITARAKGVNENVLLFKYPVRIAINPIVSTIGWMLPQIVSGGTITAVVLSLPTIGPLLLQSLLQQDMYLAGSIVLIQSFLVIVGTFISDLLLAWLDPRIRYERSEGIS